MKATVLLTYVCAEVKTLRALLTVFHSLELLFLLQQPSFWFNLMRTTEPFETGALYVFVSLWFYTFGFFVLMSSET